MKCDITRVELADKVAVLIRESLPTAFMRGEIADVLDELKKASKLGLQKVRVYYEAGFSVSCQLAFDLDGHVQVSWPSSPSNPATAAACLAMYRPAVEFALLIQNFLGEFKIVPEPKEKK